MKIVVNIFALILIMAGGIWFFQGINILPGSFMTGDIRWSIYGAIAVMVGTGLMIFVNRKKKLRTKQ